MKSWVSRSSSKRSDASSGHEMEDRESMIDDNTIPVVQLSMSKSSDYIENTEIEDDHDWIQHGICFLRPLTAILHCSLTCPLYLISSIFLFVSITLRALIWCFLRTEVSAPMPSEQNTKKGPKIFFDGAGWAFPFSLGVSKHLMEAYDVSECTIYAISAGNIAGICLLLNKDPSVEIKKNYPWLRRKTIYSHFKQPLCGYCRALEHVRAVIEKMVPDDIHLIASGRYHAVVTPWPHLGLKFINTFASKDEFIDAVITSMAVPPFVYRPLVSRHVGWRGLWVDGGLQTVVTPIDHLADVAVRTFPDPLLRHRRTSLHPPPTYGLRPSDPLVPATLSRVLLMIERARTIAADDPLVASAMAPFPKAPAPDSALPAALSLAPVADPPTGEAASEGDARGERGEEVPAWAGEWGGGLPVRAV